ncbi:MAG: response regulator transcription factor, partial [Candidatus Sulfotelmatobacter sp.]
MPAAERTIDYRLRTGRRCCEVPSQARNGVAETGIQRLLQNEILQNDKQPSSATRDARRQSKPAMHDVAEPSSMAKGRTARSSTILVADDHPMVREGLVAVINRQPDMRVVAEASNGREAVEKFVTLRPDIALLDLRMPMMDGIEAAMSISEHAPEARLVIVTTYQSEEDIYRALRAGAQGYLLKDSPVEDLIECIHTVGDGKTWIPPAVGATLARRVTERSLTAREMEVIRALAKGKSNKEIGVALNISEGTVKVHVTHMLEKLKVT